MASCDGGLGLGQTVYKSLWTGQRDAGLWSQIFQDVSCDSIAFLFPCSPWETFSQLLIDAGRPTTCGAIPMQVVPGCIRKVG